MGLAGQTSSSWTPASCRAAMAGKGKPSSRRAEYFPSTTRTAILPPVLAIFFFLSLYYGIFIKDCLSDGTTCLFAYTLFSIYLDYVCTMG